MKKFYVLGLIVAMSVSVQAQQDPQFSQNMFTKLAVNPAHAGAYDAICGTLLYRNQWTGFDGAPKTFLLMAEMPVSVLRGGLGLTIASDQLGFEKNLMARAAYAHKLYLGAGYLNLGLDVGYMQKSIDGSKFIYNDGGDQSIPLGAVSGGSIDFGFGAYYYSEKLYAGLSSTHLSEGEIKTDNVTTKLARHYYFMAGYDAELTPDITLKPSVFAKSEGTSTQIDLNANVMLQNKFWLGFSYRFIPQDALVAMAGLEVTPNLKVGYSYDFTMTDIKTYSSGTHEIMINYCLRVKPSVERQFHKNVIQETESKSNNLQASNVSKPSQTKQTMMKRQLKRLLLVAFAYLIVSGCGGGNNGQLVGVKNRPKWYQADPYGMVYIPAGSYNMGPSDQDVPYAMVSQSKTVTVPAFYMDNTEISNNEYRQFVFWVRDSLAHRLLGGEHILNEGEYNETINWREKIRWNDEENEESLAELFLPESERFYRRKEIDTRKLNFEYYWIDLKEAAQRANREQGKTDRSVFIKKDVINVYPDTLSWIHDYTYSYHDPMTQAYFWHPAYDDYPVVGVNWRQANAFCIWRTQLFDTYHQGVGDAFTQPFRLPTEAEWEYAARGGLDLSPYPWGGPYIRNSRGCFLANFKPMRGNYMDDGGVYTVKVTAYWPNDYGLYNMAGNVAEWTSNAFDEAAYNFTHDVSTDYTYDAKESDPPSMKRKVIRGGSWKDVMWHLQNGTRSYEYQDTAKCYIGFRCVMSFLGRDKADY